MWFWRLQNVIDNQRYVIYPTVPLDMAYLWTTVEPLEFAFVDYIGTVLSISFLVNIAFEIASF